MGCCWLSRAWSLAVYSSWRGFDARCCCLLLVVICVVLVDGTLSCWWWGEWNDGDMGERLDAVVVPDLVGVLGVRVDGVGEWWAWLLPSARGCREPRPALGRRDRPTLLGRRGELMSRVGLWLGERSGLGYSSPALS